MRRPSLHELAGRVREQTALCYRCHRRRAVVWMQPRIYGKWVRVCHRCAAAIQAGAES